MSKPFLEQLEGWILLENFTELDRCEFKATEYIVENYKIDPVWEFTT